MNISKISTYDSTVYFKEAPKPVTVEKKAKTIAEMAREELAQIKEQRYKAGTEVAWWRHEFYEAVAVLEELAKGEPAEESSDEGRYNSPIMRFHVSNEEEDGFI